MKIMVRKSSTGLSAYVAKKDLEAAIVELEHDSIWGGWARLKNGWVLDLPPMPPGTTLPVTVVAKRRGEDGT